MKSLQSFNLDKDTKENVRQYLLQFFRDEAVRKLMNREDTVALADATELLDKAFENLDVIFNSKVDKKEQINQSR